MRGNLKELKLRSLFHWLELERQTGILYVETTKYFPSSHQKFSAENLNSRSRTYEFLLTNRPQSWLVFLADGKITYATENDSLEFTRLQDYISYYQLEKSILSQYNPRLNTDLPPEYSCLIYLFQQQLVTLQQARKILNNIIQETLFELLSLTEGRFIFKADFPFSLSVLESEIASSIRTATSALQIWKQFYPYVYSYHQQPTIPDANFFERVTSSKARATLLNWVSRQISLLRLSRQLNCHLVDLVKALYPYIKKGAIKLHSNSLSTQQELLIEQFQAQPHIVYVDRDVAIGEKVEYILKRRGYKSTVFTDPIQALTGILQIRPDLVLCQVDLPELSGSELCSMLKSSQVCQQTRIIMLSERENFFDRTRARIIPCDDYLCLPFTSNELLILIEQYLNVNHNPNLGVSKAWSIKTTYNS